MTLAGFFQALPAEAAHLAGSWIVQVGGAVSVAAPGIVVAWKLGRSKLFANGHVNGNGLGKEVAKLAAEVKALDRRLEDRYEHLCDRLTDSNERTEKAHSELWRAVNKLRGVE